jgi:hypothetical protein
MIIKFLAKGIRLFAEIMTVIGTLLPIHDVRAPDAIGG